MKLAATPSFMPFYHYSLLHIRGIRHNQLAFAYPSDSADDWWYSPYDCATNSLLSHSRRSPQCQIKFWSAPRHIFENAPNISKIFLGFLCNLSIKLFEVSVILCKFFHKSPWKFHKISIKMFFKGLCKVFPIFFHNFY